jgi:hypothetical protein
MANLTEFSCENQSWLWHRSSAEYSLHLVLDEIRRLPVAASLKLIQLA